MERKFYPENFERFLKSHADHFKMTPSKKVWHGIYNDLHPGRRWPSVAMSMVFIFTLVIVGHLNTNNGDEYIPQITPQQISNPVQSLKTTVTSTQKKAVLKEFVSNNTNEIASDESEETNGPLLFVINEENLYLEKPDDLPESANKLTATITNENDLDKNNFSDKNQKVITANSPEQQITTAPQVELKANTIINGENIASQQPTAEGKETKVTEINPSNLEVIANIIPQANAANISKPKRINNITWTYYVTPSISYRSISEDKISNAVTHKSVTGYEGGTSLSFNKNEKLQFTTGFQVNYSGYNIRAFNTHPIVASLVLKGDIPGQQQVYYSMSHYGNKIGTEFITLKNYSLQASIPVGVQYAFAGNDNIKFNAAGSLQPSYTIASNAYMLSDDKRNYLTNPSLSRKWNVNTSFATYVSFSSNSLNWQIGPQVRYQLLSTYTNRYPVKENLVNYGIRIGVTKSSK